MLPFTAKIIEQGLSKRWGPVRLPWRVEIGAAQSGIISGMRRRSTESALERTSPVVTRFYTLSDIATLLATTEAQVYALVRSGDLPAIKIGGRGQWRIEITVFDQWVADQYEATKVYVAENPIVDASRKVAPRKGED